MSVLRLTSESPWAPDAGGFPGSSGTIRVGDGLLC